MGDGIELVPLGQKLANGKPAYGCQHLAQWWTLFTRLQSLRGRIKTCMDIVQAYGFSSKSGGTHAQGTAVDITQMDAGIVADAREAGARATWLRGEDYGQSTMADHTHLALDCPCIAGSDYQLAAADAGFNGLGLNGRGGRDYHPAPKVRRDWASGMAWMRAEIARLTPTPSPMEDDVITDADIARLARTVWGMDPLGATTSTFDRLVSAQRDAAAALAVVAKLAAGPTGLTAAEIEAAARKGAEEAIAAGVRVTGTLTVDSE